MFDSFLVYSGFAIIVAGLVSLVWPLRFLGIRTRLVAAMMVAVGTALEFIAGEMIDSYLVYLGLILFLAGLFSLIWPIRFLAIRTRPVGAGVAASGLLLAVIVLVLPVSGKEVTVRATKLDDWMPRWQVGEQHTIHVAASPDKVFQAIHEVRAKEIFLFRTLTAIRRCGEEGPESILDAPEEKSILDVATQTTFVLLGEEAARELVVGTVVGVPATGRRSGGRLTPEIFRKTLPPGFALATMNFLVLPDNHGGSRFPPRHAFTRTHPRPSGNLSFTGGSFIPEATSFAACGCVQSSSALKRKTCSKVAMTPKQALAMVRKNGVILESGRGPVPSLAHAIAGEAIRGSWWAHPKARVILRCSRAIRESKEVLVCRLVGGKVTYVHRRLWPALVKLRRQFKHERLAAIRESHTATGQHQVESIVFPKWVPSKVKTAANKLTIRQAAEILEGAGIPRVATGTEA